MTVTPATQSDMFASETGEGLLILLTIDHDDLSAPIRVVNNNVNIESRSNTYIAFPFTIILPSDNPESPPTARLEIDNVSREIGETIRSISSAPTVLIEVVRTDDFDTLEMSFPQLKLRNVRFDASKVVGDVLSEDIQLEPYPSTTFNPSNSPGLF